MDMSIMRRLFWSLVLVHLHIFFLFPTGLLSHAIRPSAGKQDVDFWLPPDTSTKIQRIAHGVMKTRTEEERFLDSDIKALLPKHGSPRKCTGYSPKIHKPAVYEDDSPKSLARHKQKEQLHQLNLAQAKKKAESGDDDDSIMYIDLDAPGPQHAILSECPCGKPGEEWFLVNLNYWSGLSCWFHQDIKHLPKGALFNSVSITHHKDTRVFLQPVIHDKEVFLNILTDYIPDSSESNPKHYPEDAFLLLAEVKKESPRAGERMRERYDTHRRRENAVVGAPDMVVDEFRWYDHSFDLGLQYLQPKIRDLTEKERKDLPEKWKKLGKGIEILVPNEIADDILASDNMFVLSFDTEIVDSNKRSQHIVMTYDRDDFDPHSSVIEIHQSFLAARWFGAQVFIGNPYKSTLIGAGEWEIGRPKKLSGKIWPTRQSPEIRRDPREKVFKSKVLPYFSDGTDDTVDFVRLLWPIRKNSKK